MVGIRSFPFGARPIFRGGLLVSGTVMVKNVFEIEQNVKVPGSRPSSWVMVLNDFGIFNSLQKLVGVAGERCF